MRPAEPVAETCPQQSGTASAAADARARAAEQIDGFDQGFFGDPGFFGVSRSEAIAIDPRARILAEIVWEALEHAGIPPSSLAGTQTGVFVGAAGHDGPKRPLGARRTRANRPATDGLWLSLASQIGRLLDLESPYRTVHTGASASLVALQEACDAIVAGRIATAIVGGVNWIGAQSPGSGAGRVFVSSERGQGPALEATRGSAGPVAGAIVIVVQSQRAAAAAGRPARARIVAWGTDHAASAASQRLRSADRLAALLGDIEAGGGIDPDALAFVEACGTGASCLDRLEAEIGRPLGARRLAPLPIAEVATRIGHLGPASGLASLLAATLALEHDLLPPARHAAMPDGSIRTGDLDPAVVAMPTPLARGPAPRLAAVVALGSAGANVHVVLADDPEPAARLHEEALLLVSAASHGALRAQARLIASALPGDEDGRRALAGASVWRRELLEHRAAILPCPAEDARAALLALSEDRRAENLIVGRAPGRAGPTAFLFSGNGAHWPGMGRAALASARFRRSLEAIDAVFGARAGWSLLDTIKTDDLAARLDRVEVVQPLLFAIQVALADALADVGIRPALVLGHSAGEVAAAHVCGALSLEDALRVIEVRSAFQDAMRGKGAMAALVLAEAEAEAALSDPAFAGVEIAATNSDRSLTLSGPHEPLSAFLAHAARQRWPHRRLGIEYPFHSSQLDPLRDALVEALASIRPRRSCIPIVSTVTGAAIAGERLDAEYWWRNVRERVRFASGVAGCLAIGPRVLLEIGPSPILTGYAANVVRARGADPVVLASLKRSDSGRTDPVLATALRVLVNGGAVDLGALRKSG
jgi:phthiocerol/phenolphthiocerol synthesis type-I polyketide synthase C